MTGERKCAVCGKPIPTVLHHRRVTCGDACAAVHRRDMDAERQRRFHKAKREKRKAKGQ